MMIKEMQRPWELVVPNLLLLPAPLDCDSDQEADEKIPPEAGDDEILPIPPRPAEERAEDFLVDWVRRFSRA